MMDRTVLVLKIFYYRYLNFILINAKYHWNWTVSFSNACIVYSWYPIAAESKVPSQNQCGYRANIEMFSCVPRTFRYISGLFVIKNCFPLVVHIDSVQSTSSIFLLCRTISDKDSLEESFTAAAIDRTSGMLDDRRSHIFSLSGS